ncbi:unnamed protein product [Urochloa humidicola]
MEVELQAVVMADARGGEAPSGGHDGPDAEEQQHAKILPLPQGEELLLLASQVLHSHGHGRRLGDPPWMGARDA